MLISRLVGHGEGGFFFVILIFFCTVLRGEYHIGILCVCERENERELATFLATLSLSRFLSLSLCVCMYMCLPCDTFECRGFFFSF